MEYTRNFTNDSIKKGDVFYASFGKDNILGREQRGNRPVVVIQNNVGNKFGDTVIVALFTNQDKKDLPTHMGLVIEELDTTTIMFEHIRSIDKQRLIIRLGRLSNKEITLAESKILATFGIDPLNHIKK